MPKNGFTRTDIWREGEWLDLWSVVHLLSGVLLGLSFYALHIGAVAAVVSGVLLLAVYELWEGSVQIEETPANRVLDIATGMASFLLVFFVVAPALSGEAFAYFFAVVSVADIVMSVLGWRASQKAAVLKKRLQAGFEARRARFFRRHTDGRYEQQ